jgi:Acetyltransferase (GNAT) domain
VIVIQNQADDGNSSIKAIALKEDRVALRASISSCELLGETQDAKKIFLYHHNKPSVLMNEIGRLREESFRLVGEGTGFERDLDEFDPYYMHIVLWDEAEDEVVGAYRLRSTRDLHIEEVDDRLQVKSPLYTASLFEYLPASRSMLQNGLELGRSFIQPKYWGSRSLEYLWYGIAAFLRQHQEYRYLFGAVSISNTLSVPAKDLLIYFYQKFYGHDDGYIKCKKPYQLSEHSLINTAGLFEDCDRKEGFMILKKQLRYLGYAVPVLYKQYAELTDPGGTRFLGFNIDPDFSDCIDGFVVVDIDQMSEQKRKRYGLLTHRR